MVSEDTPEEAGEFTCNGNLGNIGFFTIVEGHAIVFSDLHGKLGYPL